MDFRTHPAVWFCLLALCKLATRVDGQCTGCTGGDCVGNICYCEAAFFGENCGTGCTACTDAQEACSAAATCGTCATTCSVATGECRATYNYDGTPTEGFGCYCDPGFTGDDCAKADCTNDPCIHGMCASEACSCDSGWTGAICDTVSCGANDEPCVNGECTDGIGGNPDTCTCDEGWQGTVCDQSGAAGLVLSSALMLMITAAHIFK